MSFYRHTVPVTAAPLFVGRELLVRSLSRGIENHRSFVVCGGPKTGRTSLLGVVRDKLLERWARQPNAARIVPVYVDLAACAREGLPGLLSGIWRRVAEAVTDPTLRRETVSDVPRLAAPKPNQDVWSSYEQAWAELRACMSGGRGWCEVALLLDNVETVLGAELNRFGAVLPELLPRAGAPGPVALVAAGGRLLREHLLDEPDFGRKMRLLFLGALKASEAQSLVAAGHAPLAPDEVSDVLAAMGAHPYALQRVLAELETHGEQPDLDAAYDAAYPDLAALFRRIWAEFDLDRGVSYRGTFAAPEHALMQLMLGRTQPVAVKEAQKELELRPLKEFFEFLEYTAVSERVLRGDVPHWRAGFDLWNGWYAQQVR